MQQREGKAGEARGRGGGRREVKYGVGDGWGRDGGGGGEEGE